MFISNGKSLFGNTGLIISLLILLILVYFSYNKCYINNIDNFDNFDNFYNIPTQTSNPTNIILTPPKELRIQISGNTITISFTIDLSLINIVPKSFIIVLAQYDSNQINTNNNKFFLSNELILNNNLSKISNLSNLNNNLCTIVNGIPYCKYVYNNIDIKDSSGNLYYYKLGISAIYNINGKTTNSSYITPYNVTTSNNMFTMDVPVENQNTQYKNFLLYQKSQLQEIPVNANTYSDTISTADGKYELIKSQLGNYPDNLLLDSQTINKGTLSDIVDKSMAQAVLNINLSANNNNNNTISNLE